MTAQHHDVVATACEYVKNSLLALVERIRALDQSLVGRTHANSNATYLLRAYAAFQRNPGGKELAVTVNLKTVRGQLLMEADLCVEDGRVLLDWPSEVVHGEAAQNASSEWTRSLDSFLASVQPAIVAWNG
jgi:hypothetical protein